MARMKRSSTVLEKAERRAASMNSINPRLDFGDGMTLETYWDHIRVMQEKLNAYNELLSNVDQMYDAMVTTERELAQWSERMLGAVAVKYGRSSIEYMMAGGTRRMSRRSSLKSPGDAP